MMLTNAVIVAWALIIGGIAILVIERYSKPTDRGGVANVTFRHSIGIGIVQCLAMIPGVSRSGATILGAMGMGVDRKTAAEFSFFLAVPTLTGATALQLFKHWDELPPGQLQWIALGSLISFVVAWIVVKGFMAIVTRYGFGPFAWYRIIAGAVALVWLGAR
jgi:undecaprenyl-diphosphatase